MVDARVVLEPPSSVVARRFHRARLGCLAALVFALTPACSDDDAPPSGPPGDAGSGNAGASGEAGSGAGGEAGGVEPGGGSPTLRTPVTLEDEPLARAALDLLGSAAVNASGSCRTCHSLGRPTLTRWSQLSRDFAADCLVNPELSSQARVDATFTCIQTHATEATALEAADFGIYAAAAHLPWFTYLFEHASALGAEASSRHEEFVEQAGMPRAGQRWTQEQFDIVAEWFARGAPQLFELVPEDTGEACTPGLDPAVQAHLSDMSSNGWRAKNEEVPLLMFGCEGAQVGAECLADLPLARDAGEDMDWDVVPGTRIVLLRDNSSSLSTYWSRSSADGRYIGSGLLESNASGFSGQILDLAEERSIDADFSYDATFFPDNSGFLLQQAGGSLPTGIDESAMICDQSVLASDAERITGEEDECVLLRGEIGLYQQLAKSVDGDDYWVVHGPYESDDGGFFRPVLTNPSAAFEADSRQTLTPMINQGSGFEPGSPVRIDTPRQGDPILSPSGRLLVTRIKGRELTSIVDGMEVVTAEQSGYALHLLTAEVGERGSSAELNDVGRVCLTGGKAMFSFDERWMVLHHYVEAPDALELGFTSAGDPGFDDYLDFGASNIYLVDLTDGTTRRITNSGPGQYALFPHFRSDGWIYFVVRTIDGQEYFVASDAALIAENGEPGD